MVTARPAQEGKAHGPIRTFTLRSGQADWPVLLSFGKRLPSHLIRLSQSVGAAICWAIKVLSHLAPFVLSFRFFPWPTLCDNFRTTQRHIPRYAVSETYWPTFSFSHGYTCSNISPRLPCYSAAALAASSGIESCLWLGDKSHESSKVDGHCWLSKQLIWSLLHDSSLLFTIRTAIGAHDIHRTRHDEVRKSTIYERRQISSLNRDDDPRGRPPHRPIQRSKGRPDKRGFWTTSPLKPGGSDGVAPFPSPLALKVLTYIVLVANRHRCPASSVNFLPASPISSIVRGRVRLNLISYQVLSLASSPYQHARSFHYILRVCLLNSIYNSATELLTVSQRNDSFLSFFNPAIGSHLLHHTTHKATVAHSAAYHITKQGLASSRAFLLQHKLLSSSLFLPDQLATIHTKLSLLITPTRPTSWLSLASFWVRRPLVSLRWTRSPPSVTWVVSLHFSSYPSSPLSPLFHLLFGDPHKNAPNGHYTHLYISDRLY